MRGQYKHAKLLTDFVMKCIRVHCETMPNHLYHYKLNSTSVSYFEDSSLNFKRMYANFSDFYAAETGEDKSPISEKTYINFFNYNLNFSFCAPSTDLCDFCYESKIKKKIKQ